MSLDRLMPTDAMATTSMVTYTTCEATPRSTSIPLPQPQAVPTNDQVKGDGGNRCHYLRYRHHLSGLFAGVFHACFRLCSHVILTLFCLLLLSGVTFVLTSLSPGDAALNTLQPMGVTSTQIIEQMRTHLELDAPLLNQYLSWLYMVVAEGNLGLSSHFGRGVGIVLMDATYETLKLCVLAMIFLVLFTIPTGIYCALRPQHFFDHCLHVCCILLLSMPSFLIALLCLYILGVKTSIVSTLKPQTLSAYITPALCLSLPLCAYYLL